MSRITLADRLTGWRERPLVTVAVALLAIAACVASVKAAPGVPGYLGAGLALLAIAIAVIDARYFIIPNELTAAVLALALVNAAVTSPLRDVGGRCARDRARRGARVAVLPAACGLSATCADARGSASAT